MMGGPIDTRISPTEVNRLAESKGTDWFASNVISRVPWPHLGFGRAVYPGFLQLTGFMTMNLDRHVQAHQDLFQHLVEGDGDSAEKHKEFYDEYLAVMDLTSEFYLQTVENVFVEHHLPRGMMTHRGRPVRPDAIHTVPIMTIEGEKDDITGKGQCRAALDLCSGLPASKKKHLEAQGVGHYGIFNGSRFRQIILPKLRKFIEANEPPERVRAARDDLADIEIGALAHGPLECARRIRKDTQRALSAIENGQMPDIATLASNGAARTRSRKNSRSVRGRRSRRV
ncbi:MAG: polyhydroxyalkanoate depolymerase, partial [Pseudomonadota bacterium]